MTSIKDNGNLVNKLWDKRVVKYFEAKAEGSKQPIDYYFNFWGRFVEEIREGFTMSDIPPHWDNECGRPSVILRRGRSYLSFTPKCEVWSCVTCYPNVRKQWVEHLSRVTEGLDFYVLVCGSRRWQSIRNAAVSNDFKYIAVKLSGGFVVAVTKPMHNAVRVSEKPKDLVDSLTVPINDGQQLFVSPDWQLRLKTVDEQIKDLLKDGYEMVLRTRLPSIIQWQIVRSLGADAYNDDTCRDNWIAPDVDQTEWQRVLKTIAVEYEEFIFEQAMREDEVTTKWTLLNLYFPEE